MIMITFQNIIYHYHFKKLLYYNSLSPNYLYLRQYYRWMKWPYTRKELGSFIQSPRQGTADPEELGLG
jgi:hypothetical protein